MPKHHNGYRSKTRRIFRKNVRTRGLPGLSRWMIEYEVGMKVDIIGDSSFQKRGLPHRRFIGKTGVIMAERGRCFEVKFKDQNKFKTLFIGKEHIRINKDWQIQNQSPKTE
ncbi:MAG: 50S ribosomal protein L21e [Promethearchaeota archaeon]